jgi:hypothetical protein
MSVQTPKAERQFRKPTSDASDCREGGEMLIAGCAGSPNMADLDSGLVSRYKRYLGVQNSFMDYRAFTFNRCRPEASLSPVRPRVKP